jgi:hypothetical protein
LRSVSCDEEVDAMNVCHACDELAPEAWFGGGPVVSFYVRSVLLFGEARRS